MDIETNAADGGLPKLKELASALLAAGAPEPVLLDQMALLAATIATHRREEVRQQLLDGVAGRVKGIFPAATEEQLSGLAASSVDELSSLGALLDGADEARTALDRADSGILAAHAKGDYAAMASLALEADAHKRALAAASAAVASRVGLDVPSASEAVAIAAIEQPAAESQTVGDWIEPAPADAAVTAFDRVMEAEIFPISPPPAEPAASAVAASLIADDPVERKPDSPEPQAERRRLRGLIRQMRATMDEAQ
jgi:hypothetical protein